MENEEKNKKIGLVVSGAFHLVLLLAFLFIIAWKEPDPPIPEYGIELNFGLDDVGTGDIQPQTPVQQTESETESAPEEIVEEETVEETEVSEEVSEQESAPEEVTTNTQESPDVVEPTTEAQEEVKPEEENQPENETPITDQKDNTSEEKVTQPKGNNETESDLQDANQGDNEEEQGDKGNEQGTLDSRALYGDSGGGGGSSLDMAGWIWDFEPKPNDTSNENGRIVFEIKIDDQGEIISVRTIERSVSPAIEKVYREEVEKLTFSRTTDNSIAAPISTGKITFVIKSK